MTVIQTYRERPTIRTDADALDAIQQEARREGHSAADLAAVVYGAIAARDAGYDSLVSDLCVLSPQSPAASEPEVD